MSKTVIIPAQKIEVTRCGNCPYNVKGFFEGWFCSHPISYRKNLSINKNLAYKYLDGTGGFPKECPL